MIHRLFQLTVLLLAGSPGCSEAAQPLPGPLVIVGGGLLANNSAVAERMIDGAGGAQRARFAIFPTASRTLDDAQEFVHRMVKRGLPAERLQIIPVTQDNAKQTAEDPRLVAQILESTGIYFAGGDQTRIVRALERADGTPTAVLVAIQTVWKHGGVIAGSSAGAAVQSDCMICVSGQTDDMLDEGLDALDFGLIDRSDQLCRRGLIVTHGLKFFHGGIIDQHFSQYRGRLGRLARAAIEAKLRYGFGIDENTALSVAGDGTCEVIGRGCVTIVDAQHATCQDGPLGCRLTGLNISCLQEGDRFDPKAGTVTVHAGKQPVVGGSEPNNDNFLIPDIAGPGAVIHALFAGLADNTSHKQVGITLKYHEPYGHGYRFTFTKSDRTKSHAGYVNGDYKHAIQNVNLDIEPITLTLQPPQTSTPVDLPTGPTRPALEALAFRGLLAVDEMRRLRPGDPITRAELAMAIARTIHVGSARGNPPRIPDAPPPSPASDEIARVVANRLMDLTANGEFRPQAKLSRQEGADLLVRLAERYRSEKITREVIRLVDTDEIAPASRDAVYAALGAGLLQASHDRFLPAEPLTREQAALAIYRIIGFPW